MILLSIRIVFVFVILLKAAYSLGYAPGKFPGQSEAIPSSMPTSWFWNKCDTGFSFPALVCSIATKLGEVMGSLARSVSHLLRTQGLLLPDGPDHPHSNSRAHPPSGYLMCVLLRLYPETRVIAISSQSPTSTPDFCQRGRLAVP